jgi:hypothetical protein
LPFFLGGGAEREPFKSLASLQKEMVIVALKKSMDRKYGFNPHDNLMIPTNLSLTTQQMCPQAKDKVVYTCVRMREK